MEVKEPHTEQLLSKDNAESEYKVGYIRHIEL